MDSTQCSLNLKNNIPSNTLPSNGVLGAPTYKEPYNARVQTPYRARTRGLAAVVKPSSARQPSRHIDKKRGNYQLLERYLFSPASLAQNPPCVMHHGSSCDEDSDVCTATSPYSGSAAVFFCTPLIATFLVVGAVAGLRLFPRLSRVQGSRDANGYTLPLSAPPSLQQAHSEYGARSQWRGLAAASFAATIGLSAVLAELILAEVLGSVTTTLRELALRITLQTLLLLLIIGTKPIHLFLSSPR